MTNELTKTQRRLAKHCFGYSRSLNLIFMLVFFWLAGALSPLCAQTVIGGKIPDSSAILDLQSNNRGLLLPRMTTAQRNAITNPASALMVFNTSTNCLEVNLGTPASPDWQNIKCGVTAGSISTLNCAGSALSGSLVKDSVASNVSVRVPYTGGDGGSHSGQTVTSTGVTGLTATLAAGNFASGADSLTYIITGTPSSADTAKFALNIGGQSCTLKLIVTAASASSCNACCAKVSPTQFKYFMCHNLGAANTSADPLVPSWEINGGYWQWGRAAQAAAGPTGPTSGDANSAAISGWDATLAPDGAWEDGSKTGNDPCPTGYRVPTQAQWQAVFDNNTKTVISNTWSASAINYNSGIKFGDHLFLPAAGSRLDFNGALFSRGFLGGYWTSTYDSGTATLMFFNQSSNTLLTGSDKPYGRSIRCIAQ
jgi:uncharacterized protein (TIGR02145 family)